MGRIADFCRRRKPNRQAKREMDVKKYGQEWPGLMQALKGPCACLGGSHYLAGRQSQRHFVPEKGGPEGGGWGQLAWVGAQFSHSSHSLAPSSTWASFLYNLLQASSSPKPLLSWACHSPAGSNLPLASCGFVSLNEQTAQARVLRIFERLQGKNGNFGVTH